jgi:hypothetical protein
MSMPRRIQKRHGGIFGKKWLAVAPLKDAQLLKRRVITRGSAIPHAQAIAMLPN